MKGAETSVSGSQRVLQCQHSEPEILFLLIMWLWPVMKFDYSRKGGKKKKKHRAQEGGVKEQCA